MLSLNQESLAMKFQPGDVVRHRKGGDYVVIGTCILEDSVEEAYLYRELGGAQRLWAREILEMEDGRFTLVGNLAGHRDPQGS